MIFSRAFLVLIVAFALGCALVGCPPKEPATGVKPEPVPAGDVRDSVTLEVFARGLSQPVLLTWAPGDPAKRLFVVEKTGTIAVFEGGKRLPTPFLDLSDRVSGSSEQGLLGLAFHPGHATNGRFYVNYTDRKGDTRVVEMTRAPASNSGPVTERELLFVDQPYSNHNGGNVIFGPDQKLWIGLGDGGAAGDPHGNGQNPEALLGKMLVVDPDAAEPTAEIRQTGHRNPWRYSFDRKTGDLYVADVGQYTYEEVTVLPPAKQTGVNLGWNVMEGNHCYKPATGCDPAPYVPATVEFKHPTGCSITGGFVYRGKTLPALDGLYFYSDFCTAIVRSFRWKGDGLPVEDVWDWRAAIDLEEKLNQISSFGEDEDGELYIVSLDGTIWKFVPKARP